MRISHTMLSSFTLLLLLVFNTVSSVLTSTWNKSACSLWRDTHLINSTERHYYNLTTPLIIFAEFSEITGVNCAKLFTQPVFALKLYARRPLLLNNDLDLRNMLKLFTISNSVTKLMIMNIKGFNQNSNTFVINALSVSITNMDFKFYTNGSLITRDQCRKKFFHPKTTNFFGGLTSLYAYDRITYSTSVCPYVFMNTKLHDIALFQISNSFIYKNQLAFMAPNDTQIELNVEKLEYAQIEVTYEVITTKLVNKHVFKCLKVIYFAGVIYSIQTDLFTNFRHLGLVMLDVENFGQFFHSGTKWMNSLNSKYHLDPENKPGEFKMYLDYKVILRFVDKASPLNTAYAYPDKDICLFKDFPHKQIVYPSIILANNDVKCSCTLKWLLKYTHLYTDTDDTEYSKRDDFYFSYPQGLLNKTARFCVSKKNQTPCDFAALFRKCSHVIAKVSHFSLAGNTNTLYHFKWAKYIFQVFFQSIVCFLGICTNLLTILVLKKKAKLLENPLYKHLLLNSVFNLFYCVINVLALTSVCIFPRTSFCSNDFKKPAVQYFKIYVVFFMGNTLRLCSNFSYVALSLSRFHLSTSKTNRVLKRFEQIKLVYFYVMLVVACTLFSMFKMFEFKVNEFYAVFDSNFPYDAYGINYCEFNYFNIR